MGRKILGILVFYNGLYTWSTENEQDLLILQGTTKVTVVLYEDYYLLFYFFFSCIFLL